MLGIENISWNSFLSVSIPIALALDGFFSYRCFSKGNKGIKETYTNKNDLAKDEEVEQSEIYTEIEPEDATEFNDNYDEGPDMVQPVENTEQSEQTEQNLSSTLDDLNEQSEIVSQNAVSNSENFENISMEEAVSDVVVSENEENDNEEETVAINSYPNDPDPKCEIPEFDISDVNDIANGFNWSDNESQENNY